MAATFAYVRIQWQQRHGRGLRKTQTAPFAARLFATAELGCPACWSWPRVRRTLSSASGKPLFVLCQRPQKSFLLPRLRPGGRSPGLCQLSRHLSFRESLSYLEQHSAPPADPATVLEQAATFYQQQLDRYPEALCYLKQRGLHDPGTIQDLHIGYASGGSLRRHLTAQGYSCDLLQRLGLLNTKGCDALYRRVIFPCRQSGRTVNLYGRSITAGVAHRFLPGSKGGLYAWEQVQQCPEVILVEGLFDYAVLWQAGFRHVTCALGTHLNAYQFRQLCDRPRTVYLTFDVDANGSGQQASQQLAQRLRAQGIATRRVLLPEGHDPNSFFVQGDDAKQFQALLEAAAS